MKGKKISKIEKTKLENEIINDYKTFLKFIIVIYLSNNK